MTENEMLAIKERAEEWLFKLPGVTGVGLARKRVDGNFTDTIAIIVYVEKKRAISDVPEPERIPAEIDGIPTDVVESPAITVLAGTPDETEYSVLRAGIQIGCGGKGTLGFIGRTTADYPRGAGRYVLVSNQHVLKGETQATEPSSAHSVGQPSSHDCCESCDFCSRIVGHVRVACVLNEDVDGGVAELKPGVQWRPEVQDSPNPVPITGVYTVTTSNTPYPVWKRGKTTQRTSGNITDVNSTFNTKLHDDSLHRVAKRSIRIEGANFSEDGDSGSAIMDNSNRIVGILFGGGSNAHGACHISQITSQLHVEVLTTANTPSGVQTVPDPSVPQLIDTNTYGPPLPRVVEIDPSGEDITVVLRTPQSFYEELAKTDLGREFLRRLMAHRDEIQQLARIPRVIVAWRRFGGAHVTALISGGLSDDQVVVPLMYQEQSSGECASNLVRALKRYTSDELTADIDRYLPEVERLAGKTSRELLAALCEDQLCSQDLPSGGEPCLVK